jgi:hypothetical protein
LLAGVRFQRVGVDYAGAGLDARHSVPDYFLRRDGNLGLNLAGPGAVKRHFNPGLLRHDFPPAEPVVSALRVLNHGWLGKGKQAAWSFETTGFRDSKRAALQAGMTRGWCDRIEARMFNRSVVLGHPEPQAKDPVAARVMKD